jgi:hypothetical protein
MRVGIVRVGIPARDGANFNSQFLTHAKGVLTHTRISLQQRVHRALDLEKEITEWEKSGG